MDQESWEPTWPERLPWDEPGEAGPPRRDEPPADDGAAPALEEIWAVLRQLGEALSSDPARFLDAASAQADALFAWVREQPTVDPRRLAAELEQVREELDVERKARSVAESDRERLQAELQQISRVLKRLMAENEQLREGRNPGAGLGDPLE